MAENSLFPGFVDLFYTTNGHQHKARIPAAPYLGAGAVWGLETGTPGPGYFPWTAGIDAYVAVLRPLIHSSSQIVRAELWTMASPTADPVFVAVYDVELAGTSAAAPVANSQAVFTFRTDVGGILRTYIMEGSLAVNQEHFPPGWGGATLAAFANYIMSANSWLKGRDGGKPFAGVRFLSKTNDTLRKKYILDS